MAIASTLINTTGVDIFSAPGTLITDEREYAVTCVMFCNYAGTDEILNIWVEPTVATRQDVYKVINQLVIPAGETFTLDTEKIILSTGQRIHAKSSNANNRLTVTVSSMRVS
jgi:hypothetical protein